MNDRLSLSSSRSWGGGICLLLVFLLAAGCSTGKNTSVQSAAKPSVRPMEHMEIGWTPRSVFRSPSYAVWFDSTYAAYGPDTGALNKLGRMQDSVALIIIYGTWCSDSRRELPRFWKIGDIVHFPVDRVTMIAVDRTMEIPNGIKAEYRITNVPTFIVQYRGLELGRITETPATTMEQDLVNILTPVFGQ